MSYPPIGAIGSFRTSDDLADGCVVYAVGGPADLTNLVTGTPPLRGGTSAGLSKISTPYGDGVATNGTINGFLEFGTSNQFSHGTGDFACAVLLNQGALVNAFGLMVSGGIEIVLGGASLVGRRGIRINGTGVGPERTDLDDGQMHLDVISRQNGVVSHWGDGLLVARTSSSTSMTASSGLNIGRRGSMAQYYAIPGVMLVAYWNRALSDDEASQIYCDPFLLSRPSPMVGFLSSGGDENPVITPIPLVTGKPIIGKPAIGQTHVLAADSVTTGKPAIGEPSIDQRHALSAGDVIAGASVISEPAVGQTHALVADSVTSGSPIIDEPTIGQTHALSTDGVIAGAPVISEPKIGSIGTLIADSIIIGKPTVSIPAIRQTHVLAADNVITGKPVVTSPKIGVIGELTARYVITGKPSINKPSVGQIHVLDANSIVTGKPVISEPKVSTSDRLVANSIVTGTPTISEPAIGQTHVLVAKPITSVPFVTIPRIGQTHFLTASNVTSGIPFVTKPSLDYIIPDVLPDRIAITITEDRNGIVPLEIRSASA